MAPRGPPPLPHAGEVSMLLHTRDSEHLLLIMYLRTCNGGRDELRGKELAVGVFGVPPWVFFDASSKEVKREHTLFNDPRRKFAKRSTELVTFNDFLLSSKKEI